MDGVTRAPASAGVSTLILDCSVETAASASLPVKWPAQYRIQHGSRTIVPEFHFCSHYELSTSPISFENERWSRRKRGLDTVD
ncbi:TCP domain-containing protein [Psidium guajava]|nr:TCP domain-containing protein [Psidium guajava]